MLIYLGNGIRIFSQNCAEQLILFLYQNCIIENNFEENMEEEIY